MRRVRRVEQCRVRLGRRREAADGVRLVYSAAGAGETALVFIHGGRADRSFFDAQVEGLAGRYRVIAIDLAGHGESGTNRKTWGIPQFGSGCRRGREFANITGHVDGRRDKRVLIKIIGDQHGQRTGVWDRLLLTCHRR